MDHRVVGACRRELLLVHVFAALQVLGIGPAQRKVTRRILIVQRVEEQNAGLRNWRIVRDQRHFAQIGGAFVVAQKLCESILSFAGAVFGVFAPGEDVARLYYGGKRREIVEYNAFDALTTYLLWLRVEHFKGTFDAAQYAQEQQRVRDLIKAKAAVPGGAYLKRYVDAWDALQTAECGIM